MTFREWFRQAGPGVLLVLALVTLPTCGYNGVWQRYQLDLQGTVTARQDFPRTKRSRGPTTQYTLQANDGTILEYTATPGDASLPRTIPVGVHVTKRKGELFYFLNDRRVDDFPIDAYLIWLGFGAASLIGAGMMLAREQWHRFRARPVAG